MYAYVSRGLLAPVERRGGGGSWFDRAAIERLRAMRTPTRRAASVQVDSAITLIDGFQPYYRGHPVVELAARCTFEQVAGLLWDGVLGPPELVWEADPDWVRAGRRVMAAMGDVSTSDALRLATASLAGRGVDLKPSTAASFHASLSGAVAEDAGEGGSVATRVARLAGGAEPSEPVVATVDTALILLADHGLAASTTAARLAGSYRADLPAVVEAGLAVLSGARHGAASTVVERLLAGSLEGEPVEGAVAAALESGQPLSGLGQPLYAEGDPRYPALRAAIERMRPDAPVLEQLHRLEAVAVEFGLPPPNVDAGLAALALAADFLPRSGELIFALARIAGWIAHAIEARPERPVRFRATYVGEKPIVRA